MRGDNPERSIPGIGQLGEKVQIYGRVLLVGSGVCLCSYHPATDGLQKEDFLRTVLSLGRNCPTCSMIRIDPLSLAL
jgi:hypothetical protein